MSADQGDCVEMHVRACARMHAQANAYEEPCSQPRRCADGLPGLRDMGSRAPHAAQQVSACGVSRGRGRRRAHPAQAPGRPPGPVKSAGEPFVQGYNSQGSAWLQRRDRSAHPRPRRAGLGAQLGDTPRVQDGARTQEQALPPQWAPGTSGIGLRAFACTCTEGSLGVRSVGAPAVAVTSCSCAGGR